MNDDQDFTRAGEVLKTLFDRLIPDQAEGYTGLFSGWEKIAGSRLAMHVWPKDIVNHSLMLETDHPGWTQEVRMRQEGILREIQNTYPDLEIRKIRVTVTHRKRGSGIPVTAPSDRSDEAPKPSNSANSPTTETPHRPTEVGQPGAVPEKEDKRPEDKDFFDLLDDMRRRGDS